MFKVIMGTEINDRLVFVTFLDKIKVSAFTMLMCWSAHQTFVLSKGAGSLEIASQGQTLFKKLILY
jgi:hypothetical protein